VPQAEPVHALERSELAIERRRGGAIIEPQALVPLHRRCRDINRFRAGEDIGELWQANLLEMRQALAPVVPVIVDDQVLEIVERDLVRQNDLAVQRVGGLFLQKLDCVGALRVRGCPGGSFDRRARTRSTSSWCVASGRARPGTYAGRRCRRLFGLGPSFSPLPAG
jgi:hypothetical protein